ncbi:MAG: diaminopimelate epimerase [Gammaproteobacteria bacterium]
MLTPFTKMHGLGNDFVVFDAMSNPISLTTDKICLIADRHFGIGCDQILLLEPANNDESDVNYRIFNADGGEVEQCGNGARCAALYLHQSGRVEKDEIIAETSNGIIKLYCLPDGQVTVNMGTPRFAPEQIPLIAANRLLSYKLTVENKEFKFSALSMGNPHAVIEVENVKNAAVESLGPLIESHELFPERVNVGFMQLLGRDHIRLRVFERGVGETLACGTGACAAAVAGIILNELNETVFVDLPGGQLKISWAGEGQPVMMTGPATKVFEGTIDLNDCLKPLGLHSCS